MSHYVTSSERDIFVVACVPPAMRGFFMGRYTMILIKTEAGLQVFKDRSVQLTPRQRSAFILFNGQRSIDDVLASGMGIAKEDVDQIIELGLLAVSAENLAGPLTNFPVKTFVSSAIVSDDAEAMPTQSEIIVRTPQQRYQDAYPIATRLTASLGLRGFRLNLSVEGSGNYEDLLTLAPKIRAAVGSVKTEPLDRALGI